jgi:hypothetical protein
MTVDSQDCQPDRVREGHRYVRAKERGNRNVLVVLLDSDRDREGMTKPVDTYKVPTRVTASDGSTTND